MLEFLSHFAVFFIVWWMVLFMVLPLGMRTQGEDENVTLGTVESAPARFRPFKVLGLTTVIALVLYGGWQLASIYLGISLDSLPRILPDFD